MEADLQVADSAPAAETATGDTGQAVEQAGVTHGDEQEQATTTDAIADEGTDPDDPELQPADDDSDEVTKTKAEKRRERREKREAERVQQAVNAELERRDREREVKSAQEKAEAKAAADARAWQEKFGSFVGTTETRTALDSEIAALTSEVASLRPYADGTDLEVLEQKQTALAEKVAERARLDGNADIYRQLDEFQFAQTQQDYAAAGATLPAEHQAAFFAAKTVPEALTRLEAGIVARERAAHEAATKALTAEWEGKLAREQAAHAATRTGAAGDGPAPNGSNGTGSGGVIYTRDRLRQMMQSEAGMAEYRRNKTEIERQEAAGLIR